VVAAVGLIAGRIGGGPAPGGTMTSGVPRCADHDLRVRWQPVPLGEHYWIDPPPQDYLLIMRNAGRTACSLRGWPRVVMTARNRPAGISVSYGTLNLVFGQGIREPKERLVDRTTVRLGPGASAVSAVTVISAPDSQACVTPTWTISTPVPGAISRTVPKGPASICSYARIAVSAAYPAGVPLGQSYPPGRRAPSPGATINPGLPDHAAPNAAPYFVTIDRAQAPAPAVIRDWRTGKVNATIQPPAWAGRTGFTAVSAAGDDLTFVLAAGGGHSRFYELSTGNGPGLPPRLLPVPRVATPGDPFAVSFDGSKLAIALPGPGGTARIMVVSLYTGAVRTWTAADRGSVTALSWAGGYRLGFDWTDLADPSSSGFRLLDTTARGRDLLSSHLVIPAAIRLGSLSGIASPLISRSGAVVFFTMTGHGRAAVAEFSVALGRPLGVVGPHADESGFGTWCGPLWSDPSGRVALIACGAQGEVAGTGFSRLRLHFPAPNFSAGQGFFAW
jgi:hypothetical protein